MNDRNMYYNTYGEITPYNFSSPNMQIPIPQLNNNSYAANQFNDMNDRINRLERQVKRLDQRLTRLETPYANVSTPFNNEPDNNMYMM